MKISRHVAGAAVLVSTSFTSLSARAETQRSEESKPAPRVVRVAAGTDQVQ